MVVRNDAHVWSGRVRDPGVVRRSSVDALWLLDVERTMKRRVLVGATPELMVVLMIVHSRRWSCAARSPLRMLVVVSDWSLLALGVAQAVLLENSNRHGNLLGLYR